MSFSSYLKIGTLGGVATGLTHSAYRVGEYECYKKNLKQPGYYDKVADSLELSVMSLDLAYKSLLSLWVGPIIGAGSGAFLYGVNKKNQHVCAASKPVKYTAFATTAVFIASLIVYSERKYTRLLLKPQRQWNTKTQRYEYTKNSTECHL